MSLNRLQTSYLRGLAHPLSAAVSIGASGLTDAVMSELESTLKYHELLKIRIATDNRDLRKKLIQDICSSTSAELVQQIGKVAVIFRPSKKNKIKLPA
ncbi:MAG: YhbY family RNA-binding protein [Gammaproteobacteria bacterium]|nr:YhbY family RNA-binding protein [Gammaproteobacteria bacterium]